MKITNDAMNFKANKMSQMQAGYVERELKKAKNVDIVCHDMTDRDGANSALAMWEFLNARGISSRIIMAQKTPKSLGLRNYDCNIIQANNKDEIEKIIPDIAFCVDFGAKDRVSPNVLEHIQNSKKVMGFDHHSEVDIANGNYMQLRRTLLDNECVTSKVDFYSDTTAKSATSVIYRFFEALGEEIDNSKAYDLFLGLADDATKKGLVKCDGARGIIEAQDKLIKDKNAYEIYQNLKDKLTQEQVSKIAKTIDLMSSLTSEQKEFKNSLQDRTKLSQNGTIAYVEISPDDEEWKSLGGDNTITSTILNRHRQSILSSEKYENVQAAIVFYEANGKYRLSAHTRNENLLDFFDYVDKNAIPNFSQNSGGHVNRGGGSIRSIEANECKKWVEKILSCDDFFEKC